MVETVAQEPCVSVPVIGLGAVDQKAQGWGGAERTTLDVPFPPEPGSLKASMDCDF